LLRLSTGEVVPLDRTVILGRNPRTDDIGPSGPLVVTVPSPNKDISRSHVEVRLEDWNVLVTDLGSTNGTTVTVPGHPPVPLRANEPMPIEGQTEVNIADEVVFRYEVT
jgi:pSer/pThr/pTyr-binding forkhead associated (FHA) protein